MRTVILIFWGIILFLFTCAFNSGFWETGQVPVFHWLSEPNYHDLLITSFSFNSGELIQKVGHFSGFGIFAILLYIRINSIHKSLILAIAYAILTELLQLHFGRDGRLYDVLIDSCGVLCGLFCLRIIKIHKV